MTRLNFLLATTAAAVFAALPALAADVAPAPASHAHAAAAAAATVVADVVRNAADLPGPLARRGPATVKVDLETVEVTGQLADGSTYRYWTFNRKVLDRASASASATPAMGG